MKKLLIALTLFSVIAVGVVAYSHGIGDDHGYGGQIMGMGHMMDTCNMMGVGQWMMRGYGYQRYQKFLDETVDLRRELHMKRFDYFEAMRDPNSSPARIEKLEKEIDELEDKIEGKAPRLSSKRSHKRLCW